MSSKFRRECLCRVIRNSCFFLKNKRSPLGPNTVPGIACVQLCIYLRTWVRAPAGAIQALFLAFDFRFGRFFFFLSFLAFAIISYVLLSHGTICVRTRMKYAIYLLL